MADGPPLNPEPPKRTFTLRDAMLLVAGAAGGAYGFRSASAGMSLQAAPWDGEQAIINGGVLAGPVLVAITSALLVARSIPPRPARVELFRQPGFAAAAIALAITADRLAWAHFSGWRRLRFDAWWLDVEWLVIIQEAAVGIVIVWGMLALAGCLRAERSWIDRSLRAVAAAWLLAGLGSRAVLVVRQYWGD